MKVWTGRLIPNAWPSQQMIANSVYLQGAMGKHIFSYFTGLFEISPVHVVGLLYTIVMAIVTSYQYVRSSHKVVSSFLTSRAPEVDVVGIVVLASWPMAFLCGLTLIGYLGGGIQMRFMLPILPATSILAAIAIVNAGANVSPFVSLLFCISAMHVVYYSVLFPPLFADMENSVFEIVALILNSMLDDSGSQEIMYKIYQVMKHYGIVAN